MDLHRCDTSGGVDTGKVRIWQVQAHPAFNFTQTVENGTVNAFFRLVKQRYRTNSTNYKLRAGRFRLVTGRKEKRGNDNDAKDEKMALQHIFL
jgi:hypothetical protein